MSNKVNKKMEFEFCFGAIEKSRVSDELLCFSSNGNIGAYSIFLGQVRRDLIAENTVESIEFTSNIELAKIQMTNIIQEIKIKYSTQEISIIHSLGIVPYNELCLLVIVATAHRKESNKACEELVERLKKEVPIWGKELFGNNNYQWKKNTI